MCNVLNLSSFHSLTLELLCIATCHARGLICCTRKVDEGNFFIQYSFLSRPLACKHFPDRKGKIRTIICFPVLESFTLNLTSLSWFWRFSFCWLNISLTQVKRQCLSLRIRSNWSFNFYEVWWSMNLLYGSGWNENRTIHKWIILRSLQPGLSPCIKDWSHFRLHFRSTSHADQFDCSCSYWARSEMENQTGHLKTWASNTKEVSRWIFISYFLINLVSILYYYTS